MKVVVLGAGVIGVSSAYELACDGHDVTVIERCEDVALETSFANGGQLSSDHGEPLAAPGVIKKALKWLGKHDAPCSIACIWTRPCGPGHSNFYPIHRSRISGEMQLGCCAYPSIPETA